MSDWEEEEAPQPYPLEQYLSFFQQGQSAGKPMLDQYSSGVKPQRSSQSDDWRAGNSEETVFVQSYDVKKIIGKGGQTVQDIEKKSGAKVQIIRNSEGRHVPVKLCGSDSAIVMAKELIKSITKEGRGGQDFGESRKQEAPERVISITVGLAAGHWVHATTRSSQKPFINWKAVHGGREDDLKLKFGDLPPISKDFYAEHPLVASRSSSEAAEFRKRNNDIIVTDQSKKSRPILNPVFTFQEAFHNYTAVLRQLEQQGFEKPSPIQAQMWPIALQGHDVVGIAQTGTGKTIAFLLPGLIHIDSQPVPRADRFGPSMLVLSPTRELAQQIQAEVNKYSYKGITSVCVYGGGDRQTQILAFGRGVEIVIATPGRLNDLVMNRVVDLRSVTFLVLDEADRMLDMGFEPQIKKILLDIRPDRQTVMTSATWPPGVRRLAESYMSDPFLISVGTLDLKACSLVTQLVEMVKEEEKKELLVEFLTTLQAGEKALVFTSKKIKADDLTSDLILSGFQVQSIHGDREQADREQALEDFKEGHVNVLVATDVASRGLDIKDITYVVNYDFPRHIEDYVHRVGRTGRAGQKGRSLTFFSRDDWRWAADLITILADAHQDVPDELVKMSERYEAYLQRLQEQNREAGHGRGGFQRRGRGRF